VQGAIRIDGELVLKRFVARNVKPITPIVWNQTIGDQLFSEIKGGQAQEVLPARAGVRVEPAAPNVERPRLPDAEINQPMHDDVVEYPDGAPGLSKNCKGRSRQLPLCGVLQWRKVSSVGFGKWLWLNAM
jgi:hypothetical protein